MKMIWQGLVWLLGRLKSKEAGKPPLLSPTLSASKGKQELCSLSGVDVFGCQSFGADKEDSKAMSNSDSEDLCLLKGV